MQEINLDESKIQVEGNWLSEEDLTKQIQGKIETGDMQISGLAKALEQLSQAIENSHALEIKLVLSKDEYQRFKAKGHGDDRECLRKAIIGFINKSSQPKQPEKPKPQKAAPAVSGQAQEETFELTLPVVPATESPSETPAADQGAATVKCIKCKSPIEVQPGADAAEIQCPNCSATGLLKVEDDKKHRYQDHFLG